MTIIPRTTIIRRPGAKRFHIWDTLASATSTVTMCGQRLNSRVISSTTRVERITCTDCLVAAISKRRAS